MSTKRVHIRKFMTNETVFRGEARCIYIWDVPVEWVDWDNDELTVTIGTDCEVKTEQESDGTLHIKQAHND